MIEALKAKVVDAKLQAADAARELAESRCRADADIARLQDELSKLRDRYDRSDCINCVLNSELLCALRSLYLLCKTNCEGLSFRFLFHLSNVLV